MSTVEEHLASYRCTAAGTRALAAHVRDDHGQAIFTSAYEGYDTLSAMHQAAHASEPAGENSPAPAGCEHAWTCVSPQHGPQAAYQCACGQTAQGAEIGVTEQGRD